MKSLHLSHHSAFGSGVRKLSDDVDNMPMQYTSTVNFHGCKNGNFQTKNCGIFLSFALKHSLCVLVGTACLRRITITFRHRLSSPPEIDVRWIESKQNARVRSPEKWNISS